MKFKTILSVLLLWMTATSAMADEIASSLNVFLKNGDMVQFVLPIHNPSVRYENGEMYVYAYLNGGRYTPVIFSRDEVDYLKIEKVDLTSVEEVASDEPRIRFDLTRKGVVSINGLQSTDRIQVCSLDGKSVGAAISYHDSEATVDLTQQRRGVYVVSVNKSFTFKLMKP
jgi:hypothetical protein